MLRHDREDSITLLTGLTIASVVLVWASIVIGVVCKS